MADDDQGTTTCSNCGEEVEANWVKCPMCNGDLGPGEKDEAQPVPADAPAPAPGPGKPPSDDVPAPGPVVKAQPPGPPAQAPMAQPPGPPPSAQMKPQPRTMEDEGVRKDLEQVDEARRISEAAVTRSKEGPGTEADEERIKVLVAQVDAKEKIIDSLKGTLENYRKDMAELKKTLEKAETATPSITPEELDQRQKEIEKAEAEIKTAHEELSYEKKLMEEEQEKNRGQAQSLTEIEESIEEHNKDLLEREETLAKKQEGVERTKGDLDQMIEKYGDKLTVLKRREDALVFDEAIIREGKEDLEKGNMELTELRNTVMKEKKDISVRSKKLFAKLEKAEERSKEMDDREKDIITNERRYERWEEDLRQTEIHLLNVQYEIKGCVYCSAKDRFMTVDKLINEAKTLGADVEPAEEEVKEAKKLLDESRFEEAVERASKAITIARKARKQYYSYGVRYTIKAVEKITNSIKELGVSTEEPEALLKDAREALDEEDYERAEDYAKMAERIALHMEEKAEDISSGVNRLKDMILKAKAEGRDVEASELLVEEAKELALDGKYGTSLTKLRDAEEALIEEEVALVQAGLTEEVEDTTPSPDPPSETEGIVEETAPAAGSYCMGCGTALMAGATSCPSCGQVVETEEVPQYTTQPQTQEGYYTEQPGAGTTDQGYVDAGQQQAQAPAQAPDPGPERFRCPYCSSIFEVTAASRPVTATCPYCNQKIMIN